MNDEGARHRSILRLGLPHCAGESGDEQGGKSPGEKMQYPAGDGGYLTSLRACLSVTPWRRARPAGACHFSCSTDNMLPLGSVNQAM